MPLLPQNRAALCIYVVMPSQVLKEPVVTGTAFRAKQLLSRADLESSVRDLNRSQAGRKMCFYTADSHPAVMCPARVVFPPPRRPGTYGFYLSHL